MSALRLLLAVIIVLGAGFAALVVMGANLEPHIATVEVVVPNDRFAQ